jgi:arsenate reductase
MSTVLFVCRQNAGRSQMSQALFTRAAGGRHHALSAGTAPAGQVHPEVLKVMNELGIDLTDRAPQRLTRELAEQADLVITMGCGDQCPYIPGKRYLDWELTDPAGQPLEQVRAIRDEIEQRVLALIEELDRKPGRAMTRPRDLPMAPAGCTLDDRGLGEQLDRYRRLGTTALRLQERELGLVVTFSAAADVDLIQETIAVERGCCSFFTLDYDAPARQLSIGVEDPARADALAALASALRDGMGASVR